MPLDIASGILAAVLVSHFFQIPFNVFLIFWGVLFNLLPDSDVFVLSLNRDLKKQPSQQVIATSSITAIFSTNLSIF